MKMEQISDLMKQTKESWVATRPDNTDLAMYLHFWRGDDLIAMVQTPLDRDTGLKAGQLGAQGFGASAMSLTFESYNSAEMTSPNTGKRWEPHEMQYTFEAVPQNRTERWVTECLTTTAHERGGEFALCSMPYWIEDDKVVWLEEKTIWHSADEGEGAGVMFEALQHAMSQPTIEEVFAEKAKGDKVAELVSGLITDPELRHFHTDMATYTAMQDRKLASAVVFTAEAGSDRAKWIEERLGPGSVTAR